MARARSRFIRPAPRTKMWIGAGLGQASIVASTKQFLGSFTAAGLALRPFTILRTRMDLLLMSDQQSASERPIVTFGLIIVTDTATALGVTAIPDPSSILGNPEADWFVHQAMSMSLLFASAVGVDGNNGQHYTIDSKAMRKVGPDDDLAFMTSEDNAVGALLIVNGRQLIQLH